MKWLETVLSAVSTLEAAQCFWRLDKPEAQRRKVDVKWGKSRRKSFKWVERLVNDHEMERKEIGEDTMKMESCDPSFWTLGNQDTGNLRTYKVPLLPWQLQRTLFSRAPRKSLLTCRGFPFGSTTSFWLWMYVGNLLHDDQNCICMLACSFDMQMRRRLCSEIGGHGI